MGIGSWWHWVVVLIVVLILFGGGGKIPRLMGDLAKGVRSFKTGLKPEDEGEEPEEAEPAKRVAADAPKPKKKAAPRAKTAAKASPAKRKTAKN